MEDSNLPTHAEPTSQSAASGTPLPPPLPWAHSGNRTPPLQERPASPSETHPVLKPAAETPSSIPGADEAAASAAALPARPGDNAGGAFSPPPLPAHGFTDFLSSHDVSGRDQSPLSPAGQIAPPPLPPHRDKNEWQPDIRLAQGTSGQPPKTGALPQVSIWKHWRSADIKLPHFLLQGRGRQLENILQSLVCTLWRENLPGTELALAGELTNAEGAHRPLRVIHRLQAGHTGITDVVFRAEGSDLYVRFHSNPRTLITVLRLGLRAVLFLLLFALGMAMYLFATGAFSSWALAYAQKHAKSLYADQDKSKLLQTAIVDGHQQFDNFLFVQKLQAAGSDAMIEKWVVDYSNDMRQRSSDPANGGNFLVQLGESALVQNFADMKTEAIAEMAVGTLNEGFNADEYFVWFNRDKRIERRAFGITVRATMPVLRIECTPNIPLHSCVPTDFGADHVELTKLATEARDMAITFHPPWSPIKLFMADPIVAIVSIGGPAAIFAALIGTMLYFVPISLVNIPCRLIGWPTPDEFTSMVQARNAWVERVLSDMLLHEYGVQEGDRFAIMSQ